MKYNLIFGHKTPDTDSVCSAIALANLKNKLGEESKACVLGKVNTETEFVLNHFGIEKPELIDNVKIQIKDLNYDKISGIKPDLSVHYAYNYMNDNKMRTLPVIDESGRLKGIVTMKDIAMSLINTDQKHIKTSFDNIVETLHASVIAKIDDVIEGEITVAAFYEDTFKQIQTINEKSIVIVGDRYDVIEYGIERRVKMLIITGDFTVPEKYVELAKNNGVNIISTPHKTYDTAKNISLSKYVSDIMKCEDIESFCECDYLEDCKDDIETSRHSKFPVVDKNKKFLGILSRNHLLNPTKKKVILVDHNEYGQSADGIEQANILEVIDHHKIGSIATSLPIMFRNMPVGSTNTIIYQLYKENGVEIDKNIAGLMLSGILSDTLMFKSPTTTQKDKDVVQDLANIVGVNIYEYSMQMFKAGTSLNGKTIDEVFYSDFKNFDVDGKKVGVSQVFTLSIDDVMNKKQEYVDLIDNISQNEGYNFIMMAVTDIINEGSYIFYTSGYEGLVKNIFGMDRCEQGIYVPNCVSRKKQIVPGIISAMNLK